MQFEIPFKTDATGSAKLPFDIRTDDVMRYDGLVEIKSSTAEGDYLSIADCEPNKSFRVIISFDHIPTPAASSVDL